MVAGIAVWTPLPHFLQEGLGWGCRRASRRDVAPTVGKGGFAAGPGGGRGSARLEWQAAEGERSMSLFIWGRRLAMGCVLWALGIAAAVAMPLVLDDATAIHDAWPQVRVLSDPARNIDAAEALRRIAEFEALPRTRPLSVDERLD